MNNLAAQFNKLKEIKPDSEWKSSNREVLLHQIGVNDIKDNATQEQENIFVLLNIVKAFFRQLSQPIGVNK